MVKREVNAPTIGTGDPLETAKHIMKRLAETPYEPHRPLGKRPSKDVPPTPKTEKRPASKGRVHKGNDGN